MEKAIHIYQRSKGGVILFYTLQDYLLYYSVFSVYAKRHGIVVLGLALMYDHLHCLAVANKRQEVEPMMSAVSSVFARLYNAEAGLSGELFQRPFGSAVKLGSKNIRTAAGYLYNNHTNKKLCDSADKVRWNFLAYAVTPNPFSKKIVIRNASVKMRNALKEVAYCQTKGLHLHYPQIDRMFNCLSSLEKEQLTDYIVHTYSRLDYRYMIDYYGSYDNMLYAFRTNSGSEYDLNEEKHFGSDAIYGKMKDVVHETGAVGKIKDIISLSDREKTRLAALIRARTGADNWHLSRFLWKAF